MRDAYVKTLVEIQDDVRVLIGNLEKTLEETKTALFTQNLDKARMVRDGDDKFDEEIRSIMRKDLTVQVLQSPVASDWRSLMGTFRVLSELERIADHCSDTLFLEEAGLDYRLIKVDLGKGGQFRPEFLRISPNNKIPAIVDHSPADGGEPLSLFESGAILLYLAEKTGLFLKRVSAPPHYSGYSGR